MSMNVSTTTAAYANYQNNYKTGTANKKKETAQTTENTKLKENTTESIAEKNLSKAAQKMLENLRGSRNDMDFMVADFENGDNAKDILAQSDKEGYVTEAFKKVLEYAFTENDVYRVTTGCLAENIGSEKVMIKCGLIKEAEHLDWEWHDGKMKTRLEYRLLKNEWQGQQ